MSVDKSGVLHVACIIYERHFPLTGVYRPIILRALAQWRRQAHLGWRAGASHRITGANCEVLVSCQLARILPSGCLGILNCIVELKFARTVLVQPFTHQSLSHPVSV